MDWYRVLRPLVFSPLAPSPERAHDQAMELLQGLAQLRRSATGRSMLANLRHWFTAQTPELSQTLWGLKFENPVGLAAGFDKDGVAAGAWEQLGFGFAELGTVTLHSQPGNPQPRLFRLLPDRAVLNRMGFNNQGAAALAERLAALRPSPWENPNIPIGVNLGKSKITELEGAAADYLGSFRLLKDWGDYFVVNVSSPNTPGLRSLQDADRLGEILDSLQQDNQGQKPLLVKIAPDLEWSAIDDVVGLAQRFGLAGVIATNTTIRRDQLQTKTLKQTGNPITAEAGGISGQPLRDRATEVIHHIYRQTAGQLPIIGVGGIFSAEDAWDKIAAGASLVQVYTGFVYEGPGLPRRIAEGLAAKLAERGWSSITQAIGCGHGSLER
ncbi:quinone-dependent dihydroorotate dehydrogenase [Limnothrix sp. FACHB-881]|uniref:quinone-dependent dihydroorotate dehydrogenase n=1 Tax=Limnothrix sp. FACHB-881 TaxID=2692819 RepID=UPI001684A027|nr:quinone-dependent dihydroorotate dehydrogenase [Limnothrix sp. FACHB-881]MBD2635280.1 quinone-dependent dihydroorotate dehydrogenase [Limnothrix sp. FACHB-881]